MLGLSINHMTIYQRSIHLFNIYKEGLTLDIKRILQLSSGMLLRYKQRIEIPKRTLHKLVGSHL